MALKSPKTLVMSCIDFVQQNLALVDSLVGTPDIMGKMIYESAISNGYFTVNRSSTEYALKLFVDAYGEDFMKSVQCRSLQIVVEFGECLKVVWRHVTHLDISECCLGDDNDLLWEIVEIINLQVLNISGNELGDLGFRLLLARHKMYKQGFQVLESLDVTNNLVSLRSLKGLVNLPKLKLLRVSVSPILISSSSEFLQQWSSIVKKQKFHTLVEDKEIADGIETRGWGSKLLDIWHGKLIEWDSTRALRQLESQRFKSFYTRGKVKVPLSNDKPNKSIKYSKWKKYTYSKEESLTSSYENLCPDKLDGKSGFASTEFNHKRKWGNDGQSPVEKKWKIDNNEDLELLKMYQQK